MKKTIFIALLALWGAAYAQNKYVAVIHGGAGTILKENMTPALEKQYEAKLTEALQKAYGEIQKGKTSIEAVEAAIVVMEDSPLFNAGKGAVFTHDGINELDAAIMYGKDKSAGSIAGVHTIKNPIRAAIAVMQKSEHVMLSGKGAEEFAQKNGIEMADPSYFWTKSRWEGLQKALEKEKNAEKKNVSHLPDAYAIDQKFGTVGCVALDKAGNLAAGTSTGGMTNKKYGRIGDAPILGAGTYADENVGISATGWGEFFIRATAARTIAAKVQYQNKPLKTATEETISEIGKMGGDGGLIALDKNGAIALPFNTAGMYRGTVTEDGKIEVAIYK